MTVADEPTEFLPLHPLDFRILLVLLGGKAHAYRIVTALEAVEGEEGRAVYPANLYRRLRDLTAAGLLAEAPVPAGADERRRRYFGVTALGRRVARAEAERLERLVTGARAAGLLRAR